MTKLFIELYLDEDVNVGLAELLRTRDFAAETARDARQLRKSDAEQMEYAVSRAKTLLTHNRKHFEALAQQYYEAGQKHYGLILALQRSPQELLKRLMPILNQITADEMQDRILYI